jgi:hypothetical protein
MNDVVNQTNYSKVVNLLWTGGWDSTFRLLELSTKEIVIQPYYIRDNRRSEANELRAMRLISDGILKESTTKFKINEIVFLESKEIVIDDRISDAYKNVKSIFNNFGSQYQWLAAFSEDIKGLELSVEKDSKIDKLTRLHGTRTLISDNEIGRYYVVNSQDSPPYLVELLGRFHFPILDKTKIDMKNQMEASGLIHLMNKTWFCHRPINDKPCGRCIPCIQAFEKGMNYRFDNNAKIRYQIHKMMEPYNNSFVSKLMKKVIKRFK